MRVLEHVLHLHRLAQARPRNAQRMQCDIAFIEARDELAAHARRDQQHRAL